MTDLASACALIERAAAEGNPELLFGVEPRQMRPLYRKLAQLVHPDRNDGSDQAREAFIVLDQLWKLALQLLEAGEYGSTRKVATVKTKTRTLRVFGRVGRDDVADHRKVSWDETYGMLRVARRPRDNDLIRAEAATINRLVEKLDDRYERFLPRLVETVAIRQLGGVVRHANLFYDPSGRWLSLADLGKLRQDLHVLDLAWIWRRLLAILGSAHHQAGVVHGAVSVRNVLIEPDLHGLIVRNWSYSVPIGQRLRAIERRVVYPPDVLARNATSGATDVWLAARTIVELASRTSIPVAWPTPIRAHFRACLLEQGRPADAWQLLEDFDELLERNYGPRRFRPLVLPV